MAVDTNCPHRSLRECQSRKDYVSDNGRMKRRVQTLSCGLAEVIAPVQSTLSLYAESTPSRGVEVAQFIHQSVKDFFVGNGLLALDSSLTSPNVAIGLAHHRLSRICIRYLAMEEIRHSTSYNRNDFPFLHYATMSWVAHTKQSDVRNVPQEDLLELFAWPSNALVELWVRIYRIIHKYSRNCPPEGTSLIHLTSRHQVVGLLRAILQRADQMTADIDIKDETGRTPLWWAVENGDGAVTKLLLATGKVDIEAKNTDGWTPLSYAAEKGHEAVVKLLLETGTVDLRCLQMVGFSRLQKESVVSFKTWRREEQTDIDSHSTRRLGH